MPILVDITNAVATVTISQPAKRNAVSPEMWDDLAAAFTRLSSDADVRCVVLRGDGTAFCSGSDLGKISTNTDAKSGIARMQRANKMVLAIYNCEKPVIAALRGPAVGVGISLALACDLSIAAPDAKLIAGFVKIGLVPDGGAIWFLSRQLGISQAKRIVYQGQTLTADQALALGLISEVVAADQLDAVVSELAQDLAARPTRALALSKSLFSQCVGPSLESFLKLEEVAQVAAKETADHREGVSAFLENRKPHVSGR